MASPLRFIAIAFAVVIASAGNSKTWINKYNPKPNPESVHKIGNARFTVLTEGAIRIEYSATRVFNDEPTISVLHRHLPKTSGV